MSDAAKLELIAKLRKEIGGADPGTIYGDVLDLCRMHETTLAKIELVRELHRPMANRHLESCPDCLGGIYADNPDLPRECGCWGLMHPLCALCATLSGAMTDWPCPTIKALDGEGK